MSRTPGCLWFAMVFFLATRVVISQQSATSSSAGVAWYPVTQFGAVGDGVSKNTVAIQKAIDTAAAGGGGTVYFPAGRYLSGTLILKSNVTLHLDNGAVLLGSVEQDDYPSLVPAFRSWSDIYVKQALLYAEKVHHIGITGSGTIDGQGGDPAFNCIHPHYRFLERPYIIRFVECTHVRVAGVTIRDSAMWVQHYLACDNVTLEGLTVMSNVNHNNDMIDIDGCRDVRIIGCMGETGDDAITLKSTGPRACERVTISDCIIASQQSAIKTGTESTGGFRDITITNCVIRRPFLQGHCMMDRPDGISLELVDGGVFERVTISNITADGVQAPIFMRLGDRGRQYVPDAPKPGVGTFRDVVVSNVIARGAGPIPCSIVGIPGHSIENVSLRDIRITYMGGGTLEDAKRTVPEAEAKTPNCRMHGLLPAYGLYARHVNGLVLDNVQLDSEKPDYRPALICEDVHGLNVNNLQATAVKDGSETIRLRDVDSVFIRGCVAPEGGVGFLSADGTLGPISVIGNDLSRAGWAFSIPEALKQRVLFQAANRLPPPRD